MSSPCLCPGEGAVDWVRLSSFPHHLVPVLITTTTRRDIFRFASHIHLGLIHVFIIKKKREHGKEEEGVVPHVCMRVCVCVCVARCVSRNLI